MHALDLGTLSLFPVVFVPSTLIDLLLSSELQWTASNGSHKSMNHCDERMGGAGKGSRSCCVFLLPLAAIPFPPTHTETPNHPSSHWPIAGARSLASDLCTLVPLVVISWTLQLMDPSPKCPILGQRLIRGDQGICQYQQLSLVPKQTIPLGARLAPVAFLCGVSHFPPPHPRSPRSHLCLAESMGNGYRQADRQIDW